jgi:hypothetical protein
MKHGFYSYFALASLFSGCGFVHDDHLIGPYRLIAVDIDEQMSVSYSLPGGSAIGRIEETVFSVGWDEHFIVAKQHPNNNRRITNFYYLDIAKDGAYADPSASVTGPLTEAEFIKRQSTLQLPIFRHTVKSLE